MLLPAFCSPSASLDADALQCIQHALQFAFVIFVEDVAALGDDEHDGTDAQRCYAQGLRRGQLMVEQGTCGSEQCIGNGAPVLDEQRYATTPQDGEEDDYVASAQSARGQLAHDAVV